jgi:threonine aldolase
MKKQIQIIKSVILPVVFYECGTASLIRKEEEIQSVCSRERAERIFRPKWEQLARETDLHNEDLRNVCALLEYHEGAVVQEDYMRGIWNTCRRVQKCL